MLLAGPVPHNAPVRTIALVLTASALLMACSVDELDLTGKRCPCATGYACDIATDSCFRIGMLPDGSSRGDAAPIDGQIGDAGGRDGTFADGGGMDGGDIDGGDIDGGGIDGGGIDGGDIDGGGGPSIEGTVFEDVNYAGGAGTPMGAGDAALPNVRVELYAGTGTFVEHVNTDAGGHYRFDVTAGSRYVVRVVGASIGDLDTPPTAGFTAGSTSTVAQQVYERDGTTDNGGLLALGGNHPSIADRDTAPGAGVGDFNQALTANGGSLSHVDFGFSFDAITHTGDSGEGSLRAFLDNANAIAGPNAAAFTIPDGTFLGLPADPGWSSGVATFRPRSMLPRCTDGGMTLDGAVQTAIVGDRAVGPEVTIHGGMLPTTGAVPTLALAIECDDATIGDLTVTAVPGRGVAGSHGVAISVLNADRFTLRRATIRANGDSESGAAVTIQGGAGHTVDNCVFQGNGRDGLSLEGAISRATVTNNAARNNSDDGMTLEGALVIADDNTISGNGGAGLEINDATDMTLRRNVILNNGGGAGASGGAGIQYRLGDGSVTLADNVIHDNFEEGIRLRRGVVALLRRNEIHDNGRLGFDIEPIGVEVNDAGDGDSVLNAPVLYSATVSGIQLVVTGEARPGARLEIFESDGDPSGYGEGLRFVGVQTVVATGGTPGTVDPTAFQFSVTLPGARISAGTGVTALATDDGTRGTSEFAANILAAP